MFSPVLFVAAYLKCLNYPHSRRVGFVPGPHTVTHDTFRAEL